MSFRRDAFGTLSLDMTAFFNLMTLRWGQAGNDTVKNFYEAKKHRRLLTIKLGFLKLNQRQSKPSHLSSIFLLIGS